MRVSVKGTTPDEFSKLTGADVHGFHQQMTGFNNLIECDVNCWLAVLTSFSPEENIRKFEKVVREVGKSIADSLELEDIILYPHVEENLEEAGILPITCERPERKF